MTPIQCATTTYAGPDNFQQAARHVAPLAARQWRLFAILAIVSLLACLPGVGYSQAAAPSEAQRAAFAYLNARRAAVPLAANAVDGAALADRAAQATADDALDRLVHALKTERMQSALVLATDTAMTNASARAKATTLRSAVTTRRMDKQLTAPSGASASSSQAEKPSASSLLGVAFENAGITANSSGNTLTLSTTAHALLAAIYRNEDTATAACKWCIRLSANASMNLNDSTGTLSSQIPQLSQWQAKYTFYDLSSQGEPAQTRAKAVMAAAEKSQRVRLAKSLVSQAALRMANLDVADSDRNAVRLAFEQHLANSSFSAASEIDTQPLTSALPDVTAEANTLVQYGGFSQAITDAYVSAAQDPSTYPQPLAQLNAKPQLNDYQALLQVPTKFNGAITFGQQFPAPASASTSSSTTTVAQPEYLQAGLDLSWTPGTQKNPTHGPPTITFNGNASFFPHPKAALNETTLRDGAGTLMSEWKLGRSPFLSDSTDQSAITLALTGKYSRFQENKDQAGKRPDIVTGNIKLEIPIAGGLSFPLSFTVANATEAVGETYVRGNFGVTFDLDKLLGK